MFRIFQMRTFKRFWKTSLLLLVTLLGGCEDDGHGLIYGFMAAGAAVGAKNALDDDEDAETSSSSDSSSPTAREDFEILSVREYDGFGDDLLTAGLGQNGLTGAAPTAADQVSPTAAEIRKATIVNQYQAGQDMRAASGYGTLYGPAVPTQFATTPSSEGKVDGKEYLAFADDGSGRKNVTMMVQVPNRFNRNNPCIVAAPSPGSRGVYGAIGTVGEWGLKNRCVVAYTDKGTGNGVHDLNTDTVNLIDGTRAIASDVGKKAHFRAEGTSQLDLAAYNSTYPFRIAQKPAHSQQNPEADWGKNVLDAIDFAFYVLNLEENFGEASTLTPSNTLVIASGVSSGGAAALRAAEQDNRALIDGVVVAAPMINPRDAEGVIIKQGYKTFYSQSYRKPLFDVITYYNIYQPCASANTTMGMPGRCAALRRLGWLTRSTLTEQIAEAQKRLNDYGTLETTNLIAHNYENSFIYTRFANLYANAYGRFSVVENLCGYSYAGSDGNEPPSAKSLADLADDFQTGTGSPPSSGTSLINNSGNEGEGINFRSSVDVNGNLEGYLEGALCLRRLATGTTGVTINTGTALTGTESEHYQRVQNGIAEVLATGDLRGKPAIIIHGRDDALAHVNFSSRAYYALNQKTKTNSQLVYIEVTNANHYEGLNQQYNINTQVPLQFYLIQALDRMYDHLKNRADLPKSQVIRTAPSASLEQRLPKIDSEETCSITFSDEVLTIPDC
jgi:hydroxybutyrate-dimer hydrolase